MEPMRFRVHHIMCTKLYRGLGYDGAFCENMTQKVTQLRDYPDTRLLLVTEPDAICANCPNLRDGDYCANGDNHVKIKDQALLKPLHLKENEIYTYKELCEHTKKYLSKEIFEDSCKSCKWYQQGICKFEDFVF